MRQTPSHVVDTFTKLAATLVVTLAATTALLVGGAAAVHAQGAKPRAQAASATPAKAGAIVNINTASATELEALPGVGAKTAARIVDYRQKKGAFKKVEELMNVQGIGEKSFLKLKPQISVGGNGTTPPQ